jgi:excisionase family DNA binding protein
MSAESAVDLLTVAEFIAENTGLLSVDLVYDLVKRGELPAVKVGTKKVLIPRDALQRMFEEQDARRKERMGAA